MLLCTGSSRARVAVMLLCTGSSSACVAIMLLCTGSSSARVAIMLLCMSGSMGWGVTLQEIFPAGSEAGRPSTSVIHQAGQRFSIESIEVNII